MDRRLYAMHADVSNMLPSKSSVRDKLTSCASTMGQEGKEGTHSPQIKSTWLAYRHKQWQLMQRCLACILRYSGAEIRVPRSDGVMEY